MVNDPEVRPNLCFPGKEETARVVAEITGKVMTAIENMLAVIRCSRVEGRVPLKEHYVGFQTCAAANLAFGGPFACHYGCLGLGDCAAACPFDALDMANGFPVVNPDLCVGCGTCVRTCPKNIMELIPLEARVWVPCSTRAPGKEVKNVCDVGCISCKMCVKSCPAEAVGMEADMIAIDHNRCMEYGADCGQICVEKCPRGIFRYFSPVGKESLRPDSAVAV